MSKGFKNAGCEVIHAIDNWAEAVEVYRKNVGPAQLADLKNIADIIPLLFNLRPDLIAGGPPCQDYSAAGLRKEGERADLTSAFAMVVSIVKPTWFAMENVPDALKSKAWKQAEAILRHAGYGFTIETLDAAFYGTGQRRKRLIVIGRLGETDGFLADALRSAATKEPMAARESLGEMASDIFYVHPRHMHKRRLFSVDEPAPTVRSTYSRRVPHDYAPIANDAKWTCFGKVERFS